LSLGVTAQHRDRNRDRGPQTSPASCVVCELRSQISETRRVSQASASASLRPALLVPRTLCAAHERAAQRAPRWKRRWSASGREVGKAQSDENQKTRATRND